MTHTGAPRRLSALGSVLCGLAAALGLAAGLWVAAALGPALAQSLPTAAENLTPGDLDSEHLFGFTEGSDLGVPGEAELEWETSGRLGRRVARFLTVDSSLALKVPLTNDFRLAPGVTFNAYDIGAPGTPARTTGGFNGGFLETRVRLMDRRTAPFGLTLNIVPGYGTVDSGTGVPARSFATEIGLLADREIIPGKLIAAVNVGFALSTTRLTVMDARVRGSGIEVAGALAYCVRPGLFLGGEARYARTYDGLALDRFAGEAVYLGPTAYMTLSPQAWASFTWSFQVAGQATGEPGPLDLSSFDRHQMRLRVGYSF
ncbi:hypothetical protein SAMN02799625_01924 [Methylobacterium sp. UNC300MFChir4.1]|uniref:hypothetical protein n=1 Tax=Methylobacterium sp. UNC300MFChir4.1 TaxID=1502747 RepID=UPI0008D36259|nr:hypothetical protein [Methylobacterium sp. UNC300MFChir4.1]SEN81253.1 hypothetical protein SAMN02799625_01924 [Methylobacterium sp. UNC300MFChir4.1]